MGTEFKDLKHSDFVALMARSDREEIIAEEHRQILKKEIEGSFEASESNPGLNRFPHSVCFDHSRVILPTERKRGNYINANYVDGFESPKRYVLAEAPKQQTCYDWYRLLWMEQVQIVVMLCKKREDGKNKCYPYWSEVEQQSVKFQKFEVTTTKVERFSTYLKTTLHITDGTEATQKVTHFNFIAWPDHGVPSDTAEFLRFVLEVRRSQEELYVESLIDGHRHSQAPPMVIHCNAGLGRTPCFCVVDISIAKFEVEQKVSIGSIVYYIRKQRHHSLFNVSQYLFCYEALKLYVDSVEVKKSPRTSPIQKAVSFFRQLSNLVSRSLHGSLGRDEFLLFLEAVNEICVNVSHILNYEDFIKLADESDFEKTIKQEHDQILSSPVNGAFTEARRLNNLTLNRYINPTCFDHSRVILPVEKKRGNYINANYVDGYDQAKKFICMEAPMHHTMYDLWRTVWMHHSRTIVMLCERTIFNQEKDNAYWPHLEGFLKIEKFTVQTKNIEVRPNYVKTTLEVTDGTEAKQEVSHFMFTTWPNSDLPASAQDFLDFILTVRRHHEEIKAKLTLDNVKFSDPPIVVHSERGNGRTGAFCALDIEISRFNKTGIISLASTVSQIRNQRYGAVSNFTYYLFCYRVMAYYVKVFGQPVDKLQKLTVIFSMPLFKKWACSNFFSTYSSP
ncbi:receptor-type tyrosine-protein phosphatase epsilon-like [Cydia pomonella]|uniref:receptor-type tyrosine-protein phosphatase epsilon-like n=1 Tax=Cydia pomonella TaxID=82600 RepID=UPI002ADD3DE1|nr:receptor-type tyrosine-protein phosphatase epsilon-like [Cydia pomonella]